MGEKWEDQFYKSSNSVKPMYSADDLRLSREPIKSLSLKRRRGGKESWSFDGCQLNCARFCGPANRPAGRPLNTPMWSPITHFLVTSPIPKYFYQRQNITFEFSLKRQKNSCFHFMWAGGVGNLGIACWRKSTQAKWQLSVFSPRWQTPKTFIPNKSSSSSKKLIRHDICQIFYTAGIYSSI